MFDSLYLKLVGRYLTPPPSPPLSLRPEQTHTKLWIGGNFLQFIKNASNSNSQAKPIKPLAHKKQVDDRFNKRNFLENLIDQKN